MDEPTLQQEGNPRQQAAWAVSARTIDGEAGAISPIWRRDWALIGPMPVVSEVNVSRL
jgi:hypothetical protein